MKIQDTSNVSSQCRYGDSHYTSQLLWTNPIWQQFGTQPAGPHIWITKQTNACSNNHLKSSIKWSLPFFLGTTPRGLQMTISCCRASHTEPALCKLLMAISTKSWLLMALGYLIRLTHTHPPLAVNNSRGASIDSQYVILFLRRPEMTGTWSSRSSSNSNGWIRKLEVSAQIYSPGWSGSSHLDDESSVTFATQSRWKWPALSKRKQRLIFELLSAGGTTNRWGWFCGGPEEPAPWREGIDVVVEVKAFALVDWWSFASFSLLVFSLAFSASLTALRKFLSSASSSASGSLT